MQRGKVATRDFGEKHDCGGPSVLCLSAKHQNAQGINISNRTRYHQILNFAGSDLNRKGLKIPS